MNSLPITIAPCHDPKRIEQILATEFYDSPICYFPTPLLHAASRWIATHTGIVVIVADLNGVFGGYVFCHKLGPYLWRIFARQHFVLIPFLAYVLWKRIRPTGKMDKRFAHARPRTNADLMAQLNLPRIYEPFKWSPPDGHIGYIDMIQVSEHLRGHGIAVQLLQAAAGWFELQGIKRAEAHIDPLNFSSVRAFLNSNWNVMRTNTYDFKAVWQGTNHKLM